MNCPKCKSKAKEILPAWFKCANGHEWIDNGYLNKKYNPPNKACSRRVPRRGAKVVKSKSKVRVGRTRG